MFDNKVVDHANATVLLLAPVIGTLKSEDLVKMIHQFSLAEGASVIFDAIELKGKEKFYTEGRDNFYDSIKFKKKFIELLLPLVEYGEEVKKEMLQECNKVSS